VPRSSRVQPDSGSGKFENLYRLLPASEFEDFNWTTFLERVEQPSGDWIERSLARVFRSGDRRELDPYLEDIIARTLAPSSCVAFFRKNPELPFTERDYYLSKIFQYVRAALVSGGFEFGADLEAPLMALLEQIPNRLLPRLSDLFSMEELFFWTRPYVNGPSLVNRLCAEAFLLPASPTSPERRGRVSVRVGKQLRELKIESRLPWRSIAEGSHVSLRRVYEIAAGARSSPETRKSLSDFLSQTLKRPINL
jgi:hypothetical protein